MIFAQKLEGRVVINVIHDKKPKFRPVPFIPIFVTCDNLPLTLIFVAFILEMNEFFIQLRKFVYTADAGQFQYLTQILELTYVWSGTADRDNATVLYLVLVMELKSMNSKDLTKN